MSKSVRRRFDHALKFFHVRRISRESDGDRCARYQLLLSAYADGELDDKRKQIIEGHLNGCASCRASLTATRLLGNAMSARERGSLSSDMSARLRLAIAAEQRKPARFPLLTMPRPAYAGLALAALLACVFAVETNHSGPRPVKLAATIVARPAPPAFPATTVTAPSPAEVAAKPQATTPAAATEPSSAAVDRGHAIVAPAAKPAAPQTRPVVVASRPSELADVAAAGQSALFKHKPHEAHAARPLVGSPAESIVVASKPKESRSEASRIVAQASASSQAPAAKSSEPAEVAVEPAPAPQSDVARAPDNTVARMPDQPQVVDYEVGGNEPTSLGHRLHNTGLAMTETTVYFRHSRISQGDGTASIVGSPFH